MIKQLIMDAVGVMNFDLNDEETMVKSLAERFVSDRYSVEKRRAYLQEPLGFSEVNWQMMGEAGLIAAAFPESDGGMAATPSMVSALFEALGRGLIIEPLLDSAFIAGRLFAETAPRVLKDEWIAELISGDRRLCLAHTEQESAGNLSWVRAKAEKSTDGLIITGQKVMVLAAQGANGFIVSARASKDDVILAFVSANSPGLTQRTYRIIDGTIASILTFEGVHIPNRHILSGGLPALLSAQRYGGLARSSEMLGIMDAVFEATLEYLRTRKQFGVALGKFQALQHRMVDMYAVLGQARALICRASLMTVGTSAFDRSVTAAEAFIKDAAVKLGHESIQMHGGMGVSDELFIGHAHKRLLLLSRHPGTALSALDTFASLSPAVA